MKKYLIIHTKDNSFYLNIISYLKLYKDESFLSIKAYHNHKLKKKQYECEKYIFEPHIIIYNI